MAIDVLLIPVAVLLLLLSVVQAVISVCYLCRLLSHGRAEETRPYTPRAAVILALRGPDPFLEGVLRCLLNQNYSDYTVFIVVDHEQDPVMRQVEEFLSSSRPGNVKVSVLADHRETCSLKCSALIQAVGQVDDSYGVVAFLDADAPPHPDWLRDLVSPLADPSIGVTTGNRWYVPRDRQWGSLVRYIWNAGAVVQVWLNDIVWAGSMAMRREVAADSELLTKWSKALSVDGTVNRHMKSKGYRVRFTPGVIMFNEEGISLTRFIEWVQRQLVAATSCGNGLGMILLHAFGLSVVQVVVFGLLVWGIVAGNSGAVAWAAAGLGVYWGTALAALLAMERAMRRIGRLNSVSRKPPTWWVAIRLLPAMVVAHMAYPYALAIALFCRRVKWRGVEYEVNGVNNIRMLDYHAFPELRAERKTESVV